MHGGVDVTLCLNELRYIVLYHQRLFTYKHSPVCSRFLATALQWCFVLKGRELLILIRTNVQPSYASVNYSMIEG